METPGVIVFNALRDTTDVTLSLQRQGYALYWDNQDRDGDDWEYAIVDGKRVQCGDLFLFAKKKKAPVVEIIPAPETIDDKQDDPVVEIVEEEPVTSRKKQRK